MATKLLCSFATVALLACVVGGAGLIGLHTSQSKLHTITTNASPSLLYLVRTDDAVHTALSATRGVLIANDPGTTNTLLAQGTAARNDAQQQFKLFEALATQSSGISAALVAQTAKHTGRRSSTGWGESPRVSASSGWRW